MYDASVSPMETIAQLLLRPILQLVLQRESTPWSSYPHDRRTRRVARRSSSTPTVQSTGSSMSPNLLP